jgi:ABC-type nitrate/sulfonate/bicarbonate transport system substrate-binding protein
MQPFTFYLDWIITGQFAGLCWAQEKGLYTQAGLAVDLLPWQEDGRSIVEKVMAGGLCAGSSEDNLIVSGLVAGHPIKALAGMLQQSPLVLMTKRSSNIQTLADLAGRRVAMHADGIRILEAVLALAGIDQAAINLSEVTYDLDNLAQDRFDAVQGYAMSEPLELAALGYDLHLIPVRHYYLHPYAQVFFASAAVIRQKPAILQAFLAASFEGWRQAMAHREEAAQIVVNQAQGLAHLTTERQIVETLATYVSADSSLARFGALDLGRWQRNLDTYAKLGLTPRRLPVAEVVDEQFIKAIYNHH